MKIFVESLPYINPEKFFYFICEYPLSFFMEVNWNRTEKYTICGFSPFLIFRSKKRNIEIKRNRWIKKLKSNSLSEIQEILFI